MNVLGVVFLITVDVGRLKLLLGVVSTICADSLIVRLSGIVFTDGMCRWPSMRYV